MLDFTIREKQDEQNKYALACQNQEHDVVGEVVEARSQNTSVGYDGASGGKFCHERYDAEQVALCVVDGELRQNGARVALDPEIVLKFRYSVAVFHARFKNDHVAVKRNITNKLCQ